MKKKTRIQHIIAAVSWFVSCLLVALAIWLDKEYDNVSIDQFIYQLKTPMTGADQTLAFIAVLKVGAMFLAAGFVGVLLYNLCAGRFSKLFKESARYIRFCSSKVCRFFVKHVFPIALASIVFALGFFAVKLKVTNYVAAMTSPSDFIETHYVDPATAKLTFPEQKRNLIYIFLESLESTFATPMEGTLISDNYIPELVTLADENIHFSADDNLGGAYSYSGTTWTASALVTHTAGVPVQVPLIADSYSEDSYMPGLVSIGELLAREGYNQTLLFGSDAEFAARDCYFTQHGNYEIVDIDSLKAQGRLPQDYREWWGFEDEKLFQFAKEELTRLAAEEEPFNFTMLTADTHFPDGYSCRLCEEIYDLPYPNVLRCSSKQVVAFVEWIQAQPFYDNTTIVITGDHRTMDPDFFGDDIDDTARTIYNCFINVPNAPDTVANRAFGTFDMYPTTLSALGVDIEGDRLALGTDLFSDTPTLTETYGFDELNKELQKQSEFYNKTILGMDLFEFDI